MQLINNLWFGNAIHQIVALSGIGNGRNTASRVLFRRKNSLSLTEFWGKLGEFCEKLGEIALADK